MAGTQTSSSHGKLVAVVVGAALVVLLALLSAFVWPGWALNRGTDNGDPSASPTTTSPEATTPTIDAKALPDDASELLKAMPDSVLNFARVEAAPSANWTATSPLEEYTLSYQTGDDDNTVTLIVAQWTTADGAKKQYDVIAGSLKGTELASGSVKVSGNSTGSYVVKSDADDDSKAVALWQNDTAVFQATGTKDSVQRFYQKFPL